METGTTFWLYGVLVGVVVSLAVLNPPTMAPSLFVLSFLAFMEYD